MFHKSSLLIALAGVALALPAAAEEGCVLEGDSTTLTFERPSLVEDGMPVNAEFTDTAPSVIEDDVFRDDPMGDGTPTMDGDAATVTLTNDNGSIEGPNGDDVEPFDTCVEVTMSWEYHYTVSVSRCVSVGRSAQSTSGSSSSGEQICESKVVHRFRRVRAPVQEVCPC